MADIDEKDVAAQEDEGEIEEDAPVAEAKEEKTDGAEDIEAMKRKVQEMEEEAAKFQEMQSQVEKEIGAAASDPDARSVYVGQVDYAATPEELQAHFQDCGTINRVTILCDKFTGHPKGFAYIEFAEEAAVQEAVNLNESLFKGRQLKVSAKRSNVPGFNRGRGRRGYRPFRGRGRMGRRYNPYYRGRGGY